MKITIQVIIFISVLSLNIRAQEPVDKGLSMINQNALKAQLGFLASDWTEGRETGEKGEFMSADYIASMLRLFGAEPAGDIINAYDPSAGSMRQKQSYFQSFTLLKSSAGDKQHLALKRKENGTIRTISFEYMSDFRLTPVYPGGTTEAGVVFVGYGYIDDENNYNDFKGKNVKGKFILRLSGLPGESEVSADAYSAYRLRREKDRIATELGVAGIIEVDPRDDGLRWAEARDFMNMSPSESGRYRTRQRYTIPGDIISPSPATASVSKRVANTILAGSGFTVEDYLAGKRIKQEEDNDTKIVLSTSVNSSMVAVRNVLGKIEGKNKDEVIVIGAHYDHMGMSDGYIYNGADDNGSGTVGVMTLARAINASGVVPEKTIIFALWTGEEKGLLGSRYYAANPTVAIDNIKMNLNFDMISRYVSDDQPNKVTMTYTDSYPYFREITEKNLASYNIALEPDYQDAKNASGASDHRSFMEKGIPIMRFKPGHREEYHKPGDEVSTIDWDIMEKIVKISYLNIWDLANNKW
ncbi:MAG: M20/M25/M40 family metallo-hydrolase [Bacteroidales bacterium]